MSRVAGALPLWKSLPSVQGFLHRQEAGEIIRLAETQIIGMIKEQGRRTASTGMATAEGWPSWFSPVSFSRFKARCDGIDISDAQRSGALEDGKGRLRRLVAGAMLHGIAGMASAGEGVTMPKARPDAVQQVIGNQRILPRW